MTPDEEGDIKACHLAVQAALETIQDYCRMTSAGDVPAGEIPAGAVKKAFGVPYGERTVMLRGRYEVPIPAEIEEIAHDQEIGRNDRIANIRESDWAKGVVKGVCNEVIGAVDGMVGRSSERGYNTEQLSKELADKVVGW